jgi:hypothetical protein
MMNRGKLVTYNSNFEFQFRHPLADFRNFPILLLLKLVT